MKQFIRFCLLLLLPYVLSAAPLTQKYPSYSYVLSEFDIESSYIHNDAFERFAQKYEKQLTRFYKRSLVRGEGLLQMLRGELLKDGLSDLFLYLSIVESGLSSDALSPKSAAGLWQFMPKTARSYNLEVCYGVDERCDPFSSTKAAIRHLNTLHEKFGKWYLAVMAYNCGEGRMKKAIAAARTDDIEVLLDPVAKYLPKETREYIWKILLVAMIGENEMIDFSPEDNENALVQVEVAGGTDLEALAKLLGTESEKLKNLNRMFTRGKVPDNKEIYEIMIPESLMARFYLRYTMPEKKYKVKPHLVSHEVILGETLECIASKYKSSVEEIRAANHLSDNMLEVGAILLIPVSEERFEELLR
jgi:membrane-bound lytic murein transglycosylase D